MRPVSPKPKHELARDHLEMARKHIDEEDVGNAVNALFYAAEAAVVSIADTHGIDTKHQHRLKADAATTLHDKGVLSDDLGPLLRKLNKWRKSFWYEGEAPEIDDLDPALEDVEGLVDQAEAEQSDAT
ncbi:MAG: hypothetical protein QOJ38_2014 [Solirubrobacterales bacterium]|jgi:hypothetical protein|nr:hypothetical protein [Solirubrobacterales bacterium]